MAWYKIRITCGPGHQGVHENYVWCSTDPSKITKEDHQEWIEQEVRANSWIDDAIGRVERVETLPEDVRLEKIGEYEASLKHSTVMLKILKGGT